MPTDKIQGVTLSARDRGAHKQGLGHVLVIGGAVGMSGAPRLAGRAALLSGAGLVTLFVPESVREEVAASDPSLLVLGGRSTQAGSLSSRAILEAKAAAQGKDVIVLGPGLSRDPETVFLAQRLIAELAFPLVLDADALFALAATPRGRGAGVRVLTPHAGEAARLLGSSPEEVQKDREHAARTISERFRATVVLKGPGTLVAEGERLFENETGNPGLAVAGSGDVLSGMIGAFLAQGMTTLEAATAGVYLHGASADLLSKTHGERAQTPLSLLETLPLVIKAHEGVRKS